MAMRSAQSPRKLYKRSIKNGGPYVLMINGAYYAPRKGEKTAFDPETEVTHAFVKPSGGKKRIEVTQAAQGDKPEVKETWVERELTRKKREPKAAGLLDAAPEISVAELPVSVAAAIAAIPVLAE